MYISAHGFGHCVRVAELLRHTVASRRLELRVVSNAPVDLWPRALRNHSRWRAMAPDVGVVERDDLTVDLDATRGRLAAWRGEFPERIARERDWLRANADFVLGDVPPLAFAAAAEAGLDAFALANFSWDWIYEQMGLREDACSARNAYERAKLLLAIEPATPMGAFAARVDLGLLGRRCRRERHGLKRAMGLQPHQRLVLVSFRRSAVPLFRLPPPSLDVFYVLGEHTLAPRPDVLARPSNLEYFELVAAADVVVAKPGCGILGDCAANGTPLLYVRRAGFPEDEALEAWARRELCCAEIERRTLAAGSWGEAAEELLARGRPDAREADAAQRGARLLAERLA